MATTTVDPSNIQGDVHPGFPKKAENFSFFEITNPSAFRTRLLFLVHLISTGKDVAEGVDKIRKHKRESSGLLPLVFLNIAFSAAGLRKIGITDSTKDPDFETGMLNDAPGLGDTVAEWKPEFTQGRIHGVLFAAGDDAATVALEIGKGLEILGDAVTTVTNVEGLVRPDSHKGQEHFGFEDGISNPSINGIDQEELSGQGKIEPGIIFHGRKGDTITSRPSWTLDGTFLAFRYLSQLVPEFHMGVGDASRLINDPTGKPAELTGARLVGRWASGAPLPLAKLFDDPALAADPKRNNAFTGYGDPEVCPFAAHTRKMNPRGDIPQGGINLHRILRRGIPFGPEVTTQENTDVRTQIDRGLLFVSYQAALGGADNPGVPGGFSFLQKFWANKVNFPPKSTPTDPGIDPIIGVTDSGSVTVRKMSGLALGDPSREFSFNRWVVARGGEYFFVPSIPTLRDVFAQAVPGFVLSKQGSKL